MQQEMPADDAGQPEVVQSPPPRRRAVKPKVLVTNAIIGANILVFLATMLVGGFETLYSPSIDALLKIGANFGPLTADGEYWRIISSMFVHIGIMHIAMNMWVLSDVGRTVETLFGSSKFFVIYMLAGIAGALNSLFWSPLNVSAGASGAVFGAFGALLAFFWVHRKLFPPDILKTNSQRIMILIVFNLLYGFSSTGIDNSAHIGGLVGGFLSGFCVISPNPAKPQWRFLDLLRTALLATALFWFGKIDIERIEVNPAVQSYHAEQLAEDKLKQGKYKEVIAALNPLIVKNPKNITAYAFRAAAFHALGQLSNAISDCDQALALDPHNVDALVLRADSYRVLNQNAKALSDFNAALAFDQDRADAWTGRARVYLAIGDYRKAISDAGKATTIDPESSDAYDTLGVAYERAGQYSDALGSLSRAIQKNPRSAAIYHDRAFLYYKLGQYANAEKDYSQARKLEYAPERKARPAGK